MISRVFLSCLLIFAGVFAQTPALDEDLLAAARKGDLAQVKALVEKGANIEAKTRYDTTPLFFAARNGHLEVVQYLISKGANVNVTDTFYKMSTLMAAADKGGVEVVKALVAAGAKGIERLLPMAAARGNLALIEYMLATSKPPGEVLSQALQAAEQQKKPEAAELLKQAGAKPPEKPSAQLPVEILQRYAGTYREDRMGEFRFEVKDGKLFGGPLGQPMEMGAYDEATFAPLAFLNVRLKFTVEDGKATGFTFSQGPQSFTFKRVEEQKQ